MRRVILAGVTRADGSSRITAAVVPFVLAAAGALLLPRLMAGADPREAVAGSVVLASALALMAILAGCTAGLAREVRSVESRPEGSAIGRAETAVLGAIVVIGALLRCIRLDSDLWLDEVATLRYLRLPFPRVFWTYLSPNQHLLYSVLGNASEKLFGESAWSVRLPAVLLGILGIVAMWRFVREIASAGEALVASSLLAVSYHHIWFSQDARGYSGMIFFSLVGSLCFIRALRGGAAIDWIGFVVSMVLGIAILQNTAFVLAGQIAAFAIVSIAGWRRTARGEVLRVVLAAGWIGAASLAVHALVLPQIVSFFLHADRTALGWTNPFEFASVFMSGLRAGLSIFAIVLAGLLGVSGIVSFWRSDRLVTLMLVLPPVFNVAALVVLRVGAYPRSFLYILPAALLFAIRGAIVVARAAGRGRVRIVKVMAAILIAGYFAGSIAMLPRLYRYPKQDYRGALQYAREHRQAGDRIAAIGGAATAYREYYAPDLDFPPDAASLASLRSASRVWLIESFERVTRLTHPGEWADVQANFEPVAEFPGTVGDGTMHVLRSRRLQSARR